jgi:integrative and conjugative element protein (TIGR02256 family)
VSALAARTEDGEFGLLVDDRAWSEIERMCMAAGDHETGGILIGKYTPDRATAVVLEATAPPPDSCTGRRRFVRGFAGLRALLRCRWNDNDRRYYVGEWHFHPAVVVRPSPDDMEQMVRIAGARSYECEQPVLLIVGRPRNDREARHARAFVFPKKGPVEMRILTSAPSAGLADLG